MKVRLLVPMEQLNEEGKFVWNQPGHVHEHPEAYKLCGCFERKPGPYFGMRYAEPVDDEAKAAAQPYYQKAEARLKAELEEAQAKLAELAPAEEEDDDD